MNTDRLYIVAYDIADQKRWRRVFGIMKAYGDWLQLSVFQCRLNPRRRAELQSLLDGVILHGIDHVVVIDVGDADKVQPKIVSLGKEFTPVVREAIVV